MKETCVLHLAMFCNNHFLCYTNCVIDASKRNKFFLVNLFQNEYINFVYNRPLKYV